MSTTNDTHAMEELTQAPAVKSQDENKTNDRGIVQYLPIGSEVLVQRPNSEVQEWYTTKANVPVSETETVTCPVREIPVLTTVYKGIRIWFLEGQTRVELTEEQLNAAKNLCLHTVQYDIPAVLSTSGAVTHPSTYFWRYGVRTSESVWLMPKGQLPLLAFRDMLRQGCNVRWNPIDPSTASVMISEAVAGLQAERMRATEQHKANVQAAMDRFNNNPRNIQLETLQKRRDADLKRATKTLAEALENVSSAAKALGIPAKWIEGSEMITRRIARMRNTQAAGSIAGAMANANLAEAATVGNVHDTLRAMNTPESNAMADSVANNTLPADIASDYIQERIDDGSYSLVTPDGQESEEEESEE